MKVILTADVKGKGKKGDLIEVSEATAATSSCRAVWQSWLPPTTST